MYLILFIVGFVLRLCGNGISAQHRVQRTGPTVIAQTITPKQSILHIFVWLASGLAANARRWADTPERKYYVRRI